MLDLHEAIQRRKQLAILEEMARRPKLIERRAQQPRLGLLRQIIQWLTK